MRQKMRFSVFAMFWMLLSVMARGHTIVSSIPDTICVGTSGTYSVTPPVTGASYSWTVTPPFGNISGSSLGPSVLILWGMPGTAIVTTTIDSAGIITVLHDTVVVEPTPQPYITSNSTVGCQTFDTGKNHASGGGSHIDDGNGCVKVCEGSVITYTGHGPAGSKFGWVAFGGTVVIAAADTCVVHWGTHGAGNLTIIDTSIYGCIGTKTVCIDIIEKPHAFFYAVPNSTVTSISICLGTTVVFKDSSTSPSGSPIISSFWNFGDGGTFPSISPATVTHTFNTAGLDTVTLIVKNACGCTDTFRMYVNVDTSQGVKIVCPHMVCEGDSASYCLQPVPPCGTYNWSALGGTIITNHDSCITVLWDHVDSTGFGYVVFDATPCGIPCASLTVVKVPVVLKHGTVSGPKIICDQSQYLYQMPQWPTTVFTWSVSGTTSATIWNNDQNNQIVLNTHGPGVIYLECDYTNTLLGCTGVAIDTILVTPLDSILGDAKICLNTAGSYTLSGVPSFTGTWSLFDPTGAPAGGGGPSHTFTTPVLTMVGTYVLYATWTGTGTPFCDPPGFLIKVIGLPPSPDSLLGPDTACFGTPVRYIAKNDVPGSIFEWAAITGTCNFSSGEHTDATFTGVSPATIMVWRVGTDAPHCHSDTISKLVYRPSVILSLPAVDTVCPSTRSTYHSGYAFGESYSWTILGSTVGSVDTNNRPDATILWNNFPGTLATIILEVRKCDSSYYDTTKVYIRTTTSATITAPDTVCRDASFTATVSIPGTVTWNWGDGNSNTTGTYAYTFLSGSITTFTITATIANPYGCTMTVTATKRIVVLPAPVAFISPSGPFVFCGPFSQMLCADLTAGYEATDSLEWFNSSGMLSLCTPPTPACECQTFTSIGNYYVVAIGHNGCRATSNVVNIDTSCGHGTTPCVLNPAGWDDIDAASVACGVVHLHGIYAGAPLTAFSWTWLPPTHATGVTTTHTTLDCTMDEAGLFTFGYQVGFVDTLGDTCYITHDTTILVPIIAGMLHSLTCSGTTYHVTLIDHSDYYPTNPPHHYNWYLDNVLQPPLHSTSNTITVPVSVGTHTVSEWVFYDAGMGMSDSCFASDIIHVDSLPLAGFSYFRDTTCAVLASVQFLNSSIPGSGLTYLWNFFDGSTNSSKDPFKVFTSPGVKNVRLTVSNIYGCSSTILKHPYIWPQDLAGHISGDSVVCSGSSAVLTYFPDAGTHYPEQYYWMQDIDTFIANTSPTINVYTSGSYWLTGTNHFGCYVNTDRFNVNVIQTPPAVITGDVDECLNTEYTLNGWAGDDPSITYQWFKNGVPDGTTASITDPAAVPGVDTFQLIVCGTVMGVTCCNTSALFIVTVHTPPPPPYIVPVMLDCNAYSIQLIAAGEPPYGWYNWSNGMTGDTITVLGGGPYRVWYTDTFGCVSHGDLYFPKDPRAYMWIFPTGCINLCDSLLSTRYIVGPIIPFNYWAYQYDRYGPVIMDSYSTGSAYVQHFYIPGTGAYDLILDNGYCRDTSDVLDITVIPCPSGTPDTLDCTCINTEYGVFTTRCPSGPNCCNYFLTMCISDDCKEVINATVTISGGTLSPSTIMITPGFQCDTLQFIPTGIFTGGTEYITITWIDGDGNVHKCLDSIVIKPCNPVKHDCACIVNHKYAAYAIPCNPPSAGCCQWYLTLCVNNTCDFRINASVTITGGTLTPAAISIPFGSSCDTFHFNPSGTFSGGTEIVTITWIDGAGVIHECQDKVTFPPCNNGSSSSSGPSSKPGLEEMGSINPELNLIPNPAKNMTRIDYVVPAGSTGTIEVYDMMGRLIDSRECKGTNGTWQLKLDNYISGIYVVALKQNNVVVRQARLSIVR